MSNALKFANSKSMDQRRQSNTAKALWIGFADINMGVLVLQLKSRNLDEETFRSEMLIKNTNFT